MQPPLAPLQADGVAPVMALAASTAPPQNLSCAGYCFGSVPLAHVRSAAHCGNNYSCQNVPVPARCAGLNDNMVAAMMLAITYGESGNRTPQLAPAPAAMGRGDHFSTSYEGRNTNSQAPYIRAFWHTGIGLWMNDDSAPGLAAGVEPFQRFGDGWAPYAARFITQNYCGSKRSGDNRLEDAFGQGVPFVSCGNYNGTCLQRYKQLYTDNSNGGVLNVSTQQMYSGGGIEIHKCRFGQGRPLRLPLRRPRIRGQREQRPEQSRQARQLRPDLLLPQEGPGHTRK